MIRLMHLIPRYINDGTCRMLNALIKYADHGRYQIFVGILSEDDYPVQHLRELGAIPAQFRMRHFADFSVIAALAGELSRRRIQVLHTHRVRPDIIGRIAGRRAGVPVNVSTQHFLGEWDERGKFIGYVVRQFYRRTLPFTQKIINIADAEMKRMQSAGVPLDMLEVIYNGVDGQLFFPDIEPERAAPWIAANGEPVIGAVAFLTKRKGIRYLVSAFKKVLDHHPRARLMIVGDGEERRNLEKQIRSLDMGSQVELLGNREDVRRLMNSFDVFVLPSLWEPFGLVIAEAMACGKPVVATAVGGIPEIVDSGVTGLLVPPADPDRLADALLALLRDEDRRHQMGRAGRRRFLERFDAKIMSAKYQALYESLLSHAEASGNFDTHRTSIMRP